MIQPGIYEHYKGNLYTVWNTAFHTETEEQLIVYQDALGNTWARPLSMFNELVTWPDGEQRPRFIAIRSQLFK